MSIEIKSKEDFESKLVDAKEQLVVVDFFATWCRPCKMIAPPLEELANAQPNIVILKVDVDECEDIALEYNITSMPTFIFIKAKKIVNTIIGSNFENLKAKIMEHI